MNNPKRANRTSYENSWWWKLGIPAAIVTLIGGLITANVAHRNAATAKAAEVRVAESKRAIDDLNAAIQHYINVTTRYLADNREYYASHLRTQQPVGTGSHSAH